MPREIKMPQNTGHNNKTDKNGTPGLNPVFSNLQIEPSYSPGQNDTRNFKIGQLGGEMNSEAQVFDANIAATTTTMTVYNKNTEDKYEKKKKS